MFEHRAIYELVGECRELGDDPFVWWQHFFAGIAKLAHAGLAMGGEQADLAVGAARDMGNTSWGWHNGFDPAGWERALAELAKNPVYSAPLAEYGRRSGGGPCLARTDLVEDRDWDGSPDHEVVYKSMHVGYAVYCFTPIPGRPRETSGFLMGRAIGEPDFTPREKAVVQEAQAAIGRMVGGPLARFREPCPSGLPPRTRQVLRCVLEGDSDKQIAARLGLSTNTVNWYVKQIYRYFGVITRAELLARWLKRGWGNRCAWVGE